MSLLQRIFRARDKPTDSLNGGAYSFFFGGTAAGQSVNERSAMQMSAVYACVRILSEAIAALPLHFYEYNAKGGKEKALDHPLYPLLHDEPNPEMTAFSFRETLMTHLLLWGNGYAQIIRNGRGEVIALYPLMPDRMVVDRDARGRIYYTYTRSDADVNTLGEKSSVLLLPDSIGGYMSESLRDLVVSLSLDSDNFSRNLTSINRQIQEAESEFKQAASGVDGFEKSVAGCESKLSALQQKLSLQQKAVQQYEKALATAEKKLQNSYDKQGKLNEALETARQKNTDLKDKVAAATDQYERFRRELGEDNSATIAAKDNLDALNAEYAESSQEVKKLEAVLCGWLSGHLQEGTYPDAGGRGEYPGYSCRGSGLRAARRGHCLLSLQRGIEPSGKRDLHRPADSRQAAGDSGSAA